MSRLLDMNSWPRRQTFEHFMDFDHPWFNLCTRIEVGPLKDYCAHENLSFFLASLFLVLRAVNAEEALRLRLSPKGDQVLVFDLIHASSVVLNTNERMGLCQLRYHPQPQTFLEEANAQLDAAKQAGIDFRPSPERLDLIHTSVLPWVSFTSISHARRHQRFDSVPKLTFGRVYREGSQSWWPVSIEVHHALADGLHVGRFCDHLQHLVQDPRTHLSATPLSSDQF